MARRDDGVNPLDRLRTHFDDVDMVCPECGYEDEDGEWRASTNGSEIHYQHMCPNCGKVQDRAVSLSDTRE